MARGSGGTHGASRRCAREFSRGDWTMDTHESWSSPPVFRDAGLLLSGFLFHDLYFIVPLCLLCTAPCGDALSMDARRGKRQAVHSQEYRWPVELCIAWFAVQYILAGLAKVVPFAKGTQWFSGLLAQDFAMQFVMDAPMVEILGAPPIPTMSVAPSFRRHGGGRTWRSRLSHF